jgi:hypothetical protein
LHTRLQMLFLRYEFEPVSRPINAPCSAVYQALVDPIAVAQWKGADRHDEPCAFVRRARRTRLEVARDRFDICGCGSYLGAEMFEGRRLRRPQLTGGQERRVRSRSVYVARLGHFLLEKSEAGASER